MAVRSEIGTMLAMASIRANEMHDELVKNNSSLADLLALAYWDGVRQTSGRAIEVAEGTSTARVALMQIQGYGDGLRDLVNGDDADESD